MIAKGLSYIVELLGGVAIVWTFGGNARKGRTAKTLGDGRVLFAPNKSAYYAWPLIVSVVFWVALTELIHNLRRPFWLLIAASVALVAIELLTSFPAEVAASSEGLEQIYWLRRNKRIKWGDIVEINTGKRVRDVTIVGVDGTKIVHSARLADRPRLLLELKRRCGDNLPQDFPAE